MRRLHPPGPGESLVAHGVTSTPGGDESWSIHSGHEGRRLVRVDAGASLWHAVLDVDGRPERVQVRLGSGPDAVDATFTFFDNEVLVWRRGAHPSAEAIPLSAPVSLDWAPVSCRDAFAVSGSASGSEAKSAPSTERARFAIRTVDLAEGGVVGTVGPQA